MMQAATAGDNEKAATLHLRLLEAIDVLFIEGSPTGIKMLLATKGIIGNRLRLPLVTGSDALQERFRQLIRQYDL
jgi:4-hydroxy-tetrahydrodipicolinate synthase